MTQVGDAIMGGYKKTTSRSLYLFSCQLVTQDCILIGSHQRLLCQPYTLALIVPAISLLHIGHCVIAAAQAVQHTVI